MMPFWLWPKMASQICGATRSLLRSERVVRRRSCTTQPDTPDNSSSFILDVDQPLNGIRQLVVNIYGPLRSTELIISSAIGVSGI